MNLNAKMGFHKVELESGETLSVSFNPGGKNAAQGGKMIHALHVGTIDLPDGGMVLSLFLDGDSHYRDERDGASVFCDGHGAERLTFVLNAEAPRIELKLVKLSA